MVREASWNFTRQDHGSKQFRGFPGHHVPGIELGIFRVTKSSGEGREHDPELPNPGFYPDRKRGINADIPGVYLK